MRSALLCVFFLLIIEENTRTTATGDFKPIPIPLDQWDFEKRDGRVGTLQESVNTEKPTSVAAVPAHYWEDALKHSVYLTLVRDKIDQLIAKGVVVSPDSKHNQYASKEVDDHDLWEKIKKAPFDRIKNEDHPSFGDVTIMARGRLLEENDGYRFAEDNPSGEDCSEDKCLKGVKAIWSVKRVRQRDEEISTGRYHYELTFSVTSQLPKKQKTYDNPVRTFTVRETPPEITVTKPHDSQYYQSMNPQTPRPQRAIWFHRNIAPNYNQARYNNHGLDRIFSSFFSDDEQVDPPLKYKPNNHMPPIYQHVSKVGYLGLPSEQHHKKRIMHLPYKPNGYKYVRPPLQAPLLSHTQHHYMDTEPLVNNRHFLSSPDHRYISSSNIVKTTRPAVLPTPPFTSLGAIQNNVTSDINDSKLNESENNKISKEPDSLTTFKTLNKPRPSPIKPNYFPEPIRPPIYNAPPGVFVTMDKKPFKPLPPLKLLHPIKQSKRPIDFRPSPQVLDAQFSDPDPDQAFRPILMNRTNDTDSFKIIDDSKLNKEDRRKPTHKPPKKHEIVKSQRITTSPPDIITVSSDLDYDFDNDTMEWANLLGSFTKTTPMEYPKKSTEKSPEIYTTTFIPESHTEVNKKVTSTEINENRLTPTTTVTPVNKKRTRPPQKFTNKQDKLKKHKRVTTTKAPGKIHAKQTSDLTPQASSSASGTNNSWKPKNKTDINTTATSSTTIMSTTISHSTTTTKPTTTIPQISSTTPTHNTSQKIHSFVKNTQERSKNRFRQSTLMLKGTSVKHDRWSITPGTEKKITAVTSGKYPPRRKGSNFQGYRTVTSKYPREDDERNENVSESNKSTTERNRHDDSSLNQSLNTSLSTQTTYEETGDRYNIESEPTLGYTHIDEEDKNDHNEENVETSLKTGNEHNSYSEDNSEFIFGVSSTTPSDKTNDVIEEESTVTEAIIATSDSAPKNKTRCKKKKHQHLAPTLESVTEDELNATATTESTTKSSSNLDILDELLGSLTYDSTTTVSTRPTELDEEESENHEKYLNIDEEFEDFLDTFGEQNRNRHSDEREEEDYGDEKVDKSSDDMSPFDNDDINESTRYTSDKEYDEDYHERSYSLLELMAME